MTRLPRAVSWYTGGLGLPSDEGQTPPTLGAWHTSHTSCTTLPCKSVAVGESQGTSMIQIFPLGRQTVAEKNGACLQVFPRGQQVLLLWKWVPAGAACAVESRGEGRKSWCL